jgi:HD superfamily phosphohydrolase
MSEIPINKQKIINDPVYGFIGLPFEIVFDLFEHPFFQRLRRIRQLGLTHYVYPGANHTRFQHALGATYLMYSAIEIIRSKGHEITEEEAEAVSIAILLHDIGHGPFSHALENSLIEGASHENLSLLFMHRLNDLFGGKLSLAIRIFQNNYHKNFLHQLVSSQLDMDRLDYLRRDSYFTGVTEGVVGSDRIIKMLNVKDDQLVIDIKGIYSIEKFLVARRLMYWQVYFHKTVISSENLLVQVLKRAKFLSEKGEELFATPALSYFLKNNVKAKHFDRTEPVDLLSLYSQLDDNDIMVSAKVWINQNDKVLSMLCSMLINRKLFKIEMKNKVFDAGRIQKIRDYLSLYYNLNAEDTRYLVMEGSISNYAYNSLDDTIKIMLKNGECHDIAEVSDMLNVTVLSRTVKKHFLCYPKDIEIPF